MQKEKIRIKIPNPRHQITNKFQRTKSEIPNQIVWVIRSGNFEFIWDLDIGIWDFDDKLIRSEFWPV
jgi:hypothetical protein